MIWPYSGTVFAQCSISSQVGGFLVGMVDHAAGFDVCSHLGTAGLPPKILNADTSVQMVVSACSCSQPSTA